DGRSDKDVAGALTRRHIPRSYVPVGGGDEELVRAGTEFGGLDLASCTDRSKALAVARVPDHRPPTAGSHGEPAVAADDRHPERTAVEELRPWLPPGREGDGAAVLSAGHTESGPAELDAHHAARSDVENGTTARLDERLAQ